jgi:putative aldouronate transport system substrate-binding protein
MRKYLRIGAFLLAVILCVSSFVGCMKTQTKTTNSVDKLLNQTGTPIAKQMITLKFLTSKSPTEQAYDQMDVFKELEKRTNIHIEWNNPPDANFKEVYATVMASGDLPDVISNMPSTDILKYGEQGTIISLNDLYNSYAPSLQNWVKKFPKIIKNITSLNGNIYFMPTKIFDYYDWNGPYCVRTDWLKKLNLSEPVTIDDWYNMLVAFKNSDLSGKGKGTIIPFSTNSLLNMEGFVASWGVLPIFYSDPKDGNNIKYGPIQVKYEEALQWLHKCYSEGLIDSEFATINEQQFQSKMTQNLVGSFRGSVRGDLATFNQTLPSKIPGFSASGAVPPKGPYGDQIAAQTPPDPMLTDRGCVITSSDKYPAETMRLIDYCYSDAGVRLINFGVEGKEYTMQNGVPTYTDYVLKNPNGLSPLTATGWFGPNSGNQFPEVYSLQAVKQIEDPSVAQVRDKYLGPYGSICFKYSLPALQFEPADDKVRSNTMTDVQSYVDESFINFVKKGDFTAWDSYVSKIKGMDIDKITAIYQKAFNQYNKK